MNETIGIAGPQLVEVDSPRGTVEIEYQWLYPERHDRELIIFLHEGLGSISMWRDWPAQVCAATGCRGLQYSRYGYGQSTPKPREERRGIDYLHQDAKEDLPAFLKALGLEDERPILFGHSDGGSIALLYAAIHPAKVRAIAVAAPHIFVEDITVEGIREAKALYESTDFPQRLARHHRDVDSVFYAWTDIWLDPAFKAWNIEAELARITCPILAIQGEDDEYGTMEQIRGIKRQAPHTRLLEIPQCGHSPHRDQPEAVIRGLTTFLHEIGVKVDT